jgi:hypothetical protein
VIVTISIIVFVYYFIVIYLYYTIIMTIIMMMIIIIMITIIIIIITIILVPQVVQAHKLFGLCVVRETACSGRIGSNRGTLSFLKQSECEFLF